MATLLADPPAAPGGQQAPAAPAPPAAATAGPQAQHACVRCGAPMRAEQDWCLQCGAGAPGSLRAPSQGRMTAATVLLAVVLLVAGAGAAAYAALSKTSSKRRPASALARPAAVLASVPGTAAAPPPATIPAPAIPKLGAIKLHTPLLKSTKTPLVTNTTAPAAGTTPITTPTTTPTTTGSKTQTGGGSPAPAAKGPVAIVLDTNAASTYNPSGYPASNFGDPSLAIDGETATSWTAQVDPTVAPKMAEGLLIDLKSPQKLLAMLLTTATPEMTVQAYGSAAETAPPSITDPQWTHLSKLVLVKKRKLRIALNSPKRAFRFVTLWISEAPASAIGTPAAPGHVRVNEIELFPAG